jgi:hypothetical protein
VTRKAGDAGNDGLAGSVDRFRNEAAVWLTVRLGVAWLTVWCFIWGAGVLILRVSAGLETKPLLTGVAGALCIIPVAVLVARRQLPSRHAIRAMLDARNACGGLAMAAEEVDPGAWSERIEPSRPPKLIWHGRRKALILALACVFLVASFFAPRGALSQVGPKPLDISGELAEQTAQIEVLEQEEIIDAEQAQELAEKLDRIEADADGSDPVKTWEAIDHMRESLAALADEAAEQMVNDSESLETAEGLAEAMDMAAEQMDEAAMAAAMEELSEMLEQACEESESLCDALSESGEAADAAKEGALTPQQLSELAEQLSQCRQGMCDSMQRLAEAGMISSEQLARMLEGQPLDAQQLAEALAQLSEMLAEGGSGEGAEEGVGAEGAELIQLMLEAAQNGELPGQGGISRGRGDAAMTWQDPSSYEGTEFQEEKLTAEGLADLRQSQLTGLSSGRPDVGDGDGSSAGGALDPASAGGGSAHTATVLPRHKAAVERYFQHEDSP